MHKGKNKVFQDKQLVRARSELGAQAKASAPREMKIK